MAQKQLQKDKKTFILYSFMSICVMVEFIMMMIFPMRVNTLTDFTFFCSWILWITYRRKYINLDDFVDEDK